MTEFVVPDTLTPMPAQKFLRRHCGISLSLWRKIKQTGSLERAGQLIFPDTLVAPNETIRVSWELDCKIPATAIPLSICYEDSYLLVVDKPAGMLVHPTVARETDTLANAIIHYYSQCKLTWGFHPVHRLDRKTSGLVLIAKRPDIQHQLMLKGKTLNRVYWAIIAGQPPATSGTINAPIDRRPDSIIERHVAATGQPAITHYRLLKRFQDASLLELELDTGRTHQIRVHLASLGTPLLGDTLYGGNADLIERQALHAIRLSFPHPVSQVPLCITSPLASDLQNLMKHLAR